MMDAAPPQEDGINDFAAAVRRMLPQVAAARAAGYLPGTPGRTGQEDDLENTLPVACVVLPDLCLASICRYIARHSGRLPGYLAKCCESAGPAAGRSVRGACIAWRGRGLLLVDERDPPSEQRFSLAHEAAHFLIDHYLPRQNVIARMGVGVADVLDGRRAASLGERFHSLLRGATLQWHTHLYERGTPRRGQAEMDADAFACLLLSPPFTLADLGRGDAASCHAAIVAASGCPAGMSALYRAALKQLADETAAEQSPPRHPLLARLTRGRTTEENS